MKTSYRITTQWVCLLNLLFGITTPMFLVLDYMGAFDYRCHLSTTDFFHEFQETRLFSVYLCFEMTITRIWLIYETQRLLALANHTSTRPWAYTDRRIWMAAAATTAVLLDIGSILWLWRVPHACDESVRTVDEWKTIGPLCRHSIDTDSTIQLVHVANLATTVVMTIAIMAYTTTNEFRQ